MVKHIHHITPRHAGGSDDASNLIEVSVTEHIMWHFTRWQLYGNYKDKVAYKFLANAPDATEENERMRLALAQEAYDNLPEEYWIQKGKNISAAKRRPDRVAKVSATMKEQRKNGLALTEEGAKRVREGSRRGGEHHNKRILCVETGKVFFSIREAARETHTSRNTIKRHIRRGLGKWVEMC